jgi:hypothetical protein
MQKDTVLLGVEEYNSLRDFKQKIEEGKTMVINSEWSYGYKHFITTEKAVIEIAESNKILQKENEKLRNLKDTILNDIKKMSYWEWRKWRKS